VAYAESWKQPLPSGADSREELNRLTQAVDAALAEKYRPSAPIPDMSNGTVMMTRSIAAANPAEGSREFVIQIALQVEQSTPQPDGSSRLVVTPRVAVEVTRRKGQMNWLEQDSQADVDALTRELLTLLSQLPQQAGTP
jgi:flagellar basal body P-ring protein FlgI